MAHGQGQRYWENGDEGGAVSNPVKNLHDTGYGPGTAVPMVTVTKDGQIFVNVADLNLYDGGPEFQVNRGAARWLACRLLEAAAISEIASSG